MKTVTLTTGEWAEILTALKFKGSGACLTLHDSLWEKILTAKTEEVPCPKPKPGENPTA